MNTNFVNILPLISTIFVFSLGSFVYSRNRKSKLNIIFALIAIVVSIWLFGTFMMFISRTDAQAIFWDRFIYMGVVFVPALMYHFSIIFSKRKGQKKLLILSYIFSFLFLVLSRTDYFVSDLFRYTWGVHTQAKLFHHIFLINFFYFLILTLRNFYQYYRSKVLKGLERTRAKYVLLAFFVLIIVGSTAYAPAYKISIYPFSFSSGLVFTIILAYAIVRYRLMDIRVAIKRSTVFSGLVIVITAAYALAAFLLSWIFFGGIYTFRTQVIIGLIVAFLVSVGFRPLYDWLRKTTDAFLFKGEYRPQELVANVSDFLSQTLDLNKVIDFLKKRIVQALRVDKMEIMVLDEPFQQVKALQKAQDKIKGISLNKGDLTMKSDKKPLAKLIGYFGRQREVLVLEELKRKKAEKNLVIQDTPLIKEMEKLETALVIPLLLKERLVGLFLLQPKRSGDMFTNEDIKVLETIAAQAAIAIENARLYEEMKDFSKTLQKEVARQTKSLREANIRLEQLDKAKSEFISLASHQLRTPLSIIKGYVSMMIEGDWGEPNPEQKKQLEKIYLSNERLIKLVEDLLTVSRIESGRLEFDLQPLSLDDLTEGIVKEFSQMAARKELYLKYFKPKKLLSKVKVDSLKIRQVIQNLIDNAIHYTRKGGIIVNLQEKNNKIVFSIKDTGIGVSEEEKITLFERFSRGKEVGKMNTEGVGLGLYLAAKLINAHQGRIWVESEGKNKGSTFYFELPIKIKNK